MRAIPPSPTGQSYRSSWVVYYERLLKGLSNAGYPICATTSTELCNNIAVPRIVPVPSVAAAPVRCAYCGAQNCTTGVMSQVEPFLW